MIHCRSNTATGRQTVPQIAPVGQTAVCQAHQGFDSRPTAATGSSIVSTTPDPTNDASEIRQLPTPYLPELSPIRTTIAVQALDTIDAICRGVARCREGAITADEADYITA